MTDWRAELISRSDVRDRIEALRYDVDLGIEAAENFVMEAETDGRGGVPRPSLMGWSRRAALVRELEQR